jgi:hypothetical protein
MKINRVPKGNKKIILATIVIVIAIAAALGIYVYALKGKILGWSPYSQSTSNSSINYDKPTKEQKESGETIKTQSINPEDTSKPNVSGSDQPATPVPQASGKGKVAATLTSANQNGSLLQIRFDISAITSSGTCNLTLKKGAAVVTKTAEVQALPGGATCKGFDIPVVELSAGTWQLSLHFENDTLIADTTGTAIVQ